LSDANPRINASADFNRVLQEMLEDARSVTGAHCDAMGSSVIRRRWKTSRRPGCRRRRWASC